MEEGTRCGTEQEAKGVGFENPKKRVNSKLNAMPNKYRAEEEVGS